MLLYVISTSPNGKGDVGRRCGQPRRVRHTLFAWARECQHAFDTLQKAISNAPVLALPDPEAKYCLHVVAGQYAMGPVLSQVQNKIEKVLGYISRKLHDVVTRYPAYDRELLGMQDTILYWTFNLHRAEQPVLVHTDHAILRWIRTQLHVTVRQMDILTVLKNFDWEVKHIPGVKNQVADTLYGHPDFQREYSSLLALEVTATGEWVDDIKVGIIDDEWFGPIAHCLANPSPHPPPSTASTKESTLWVAAQRFYLEENGLLWLHGDLEQTQVNKTARAKEKEEDGKADMRGRLCIPKTKQ